MYCLLIVPFSKMQCVLNFSWRKRDPDFVSSSPQSENPKNHSNNLTIWIKKYTEKWVGIWRVIFLLPAHICSWSKVNNREILREQIYKIWKKMSWKTWQWSLCCFPFGFFLPKRIFSLQSLSSLFNTMSRVYIPELRVGCWLHLPLIRWLLYLVIHQ